METIDFTHGEEARRKINAWVKEKTNDKIEDVVPPGALDEWTRLVLTNAIYFNAPWENPFENAETRDLPFHVSASAQVEVPTMTRTEGFAYARVAGLSLIELPYQGGQVAMAILLPDTADGLEDLEPRLSGTQLQKWLAALKRTKVEVFLPRFRMTAALDLIPSMKALGMRSAFTERADFSGIDGGRDTLYIDLMAHKAYVDVNESGTEAAAATVEAMRALGYTESSAAPVFRADHPFVFLIRDVRTGTILFLGRVVDPSRA